MRNKRNVDAPGVWWRSRSGFTLVELLVVIAILAVLMSILIPSLKRAREQAKEVVCASHLRGTGLGFEMYVQDNNDRYPVQSDSKELSMWHMEVSNIEHIQMNYFDGSIETFFCPNFFSAGSYAQNLDLNRLYWYEGRDEKGEASWYTFQYRIMGYAGFMASTLPEEWRVTKKSGPSQPLFMDMIKSYDAEGKIFDYMISHWDKDNSEPSGANIVFTDTHVKWRRFAEMEPRFGYSTRRYFW